MRVPRVYRSASDVYRQSNYLNNFEPQLGGRFEFHAYTGALLTFIQGQIIIYIILKTK